jgi:serine/threonine protein kinase
MVQINHPESLRRLGDFEIGREIGRGGMGIVYEARQVSLNRKVALKVLSGGLGLTPRAVQRFQREAEAAAKLHHTNIVPIYATGEQDGTHFYAMELIDGPSLDHVIGQMRQANEHPSPDLKNQHDKEAPRPPELEATGPYLAQSGSTQALSASSLSSDSHYFDTVARLIADVADALEHAHQNGVIHRDIKPSNLLLSQAGRLSINDFVLARLLEQPGMTMTGEFVGTPAYMSPEQITAGRIPLDHRTDIYSLGATLYELLTLRPPFRGQSREQVLAQIVQKEPPAPRRVDRRVPVDLETICLKCLEKDPDRRYQTAGQLAEDLRRYVNRFAISARRVGPVQRLIKWARRRPAVAASLGCVLLAVCLMLAFAYLAHRAEKQRAEEQERHRLQFLDEKIRNAYMVAMSGDLKKTDDAIKEIEELGGSPGQVRLLRGMVSYFRGDIASAISELDQAVKLLPESMAARALLSFCYVTNDEYKPAGQHLQELERLSASSAEDYLFKGLAQEGLGEKGLANLDEGIRQRDSALGRALRARARATRAVDTATADQKGVEEALADADAAWHMMRDNPYVLHVSIQVRTIAAFIYREAELLEKHAAVLRDAHRDVQALERVLDDVPILYSPVCEYYAHTGERDKALKVARRAMRSGSPSAANACAFELYRQGKFEEALQCLGPRRQIDYGGALRAFVLAEMRDGPARALKEFEECSGELLKEVPLNYWALEDSKDVLLLLGKREQALAMGQKLGLDRTRKAEWEYYRGKLSEDEYLASAGDARQAQVDAHYHMGLFRLSMGDRLGARKHFQKEARYYWGFGKEYSQMFLSRMDKDPKWPPWIPLKKD